MTIDLPAAISVSGPWVHFVSNERDLLALTEEARANNILVISLDGHKMRTVDSLFIEYARAFRFPDYFGHNWPAFTECMQVLENLAARGYLTVVLNGDEVLQSDLADRPTYRRLLSEIGKYWANSFALGDEWGGGEVPFNTVFFGKPI